MEFHERRLFDGMLQIAETAMLKVANEIAIVDEPDFEKQADEIVERIQQLRLSLAHKVLGGGMG